mgnify:CR=1 FL=1
MKTLVEWCWSEAFDKFGFNDGDGLNFTDEVAIFIESLRYEKIFTFRINKKVTR